MITVREQIQAVEREINFRKRAYPKRVETAQMTRTEAEYQIKVMESIKLSLLLMPQDCSLVKL